MAIITTQPGVSTSAALVASNTARDPGEGDYRTRGFLVKNLTGGDVFLGPSTVTTANGFKWSLADGPLFIELEPGEELWGIAASAQTLHVLESGR